MRRTAFMECHFILSDLNPVIFNEGNHLAHLFDHMSDISLVLEIYEGGYLSYL